MQNAGIKKLASSTSF